MRVVTMAAANIINDTRVKREALTLALAGYETTCLSRAVGVGDVRPLGDAILLKVPVPPTVQKAVLERRARRRAWRPLPGWLADRPSRDAFARRQQAREQADVSLASARLLPPRLRRRGRRAVTRRALAVAERVDERMQRAWEAFDERVHGSTIGARWRTTLDGLVDDLEASYGPLLDALRPDAIHAHDMHVLGVAVHAARRAAEAGRTVKVVYDAHEFVPGLAVAGAFTPRTIAAWADLEADYIRAADRVIAVSEATAAAIQERFGMERTPDVVLNVPVPDPVQPPPETIRDAAGVGDAPLVVYAGVLRDVRGVDTAIAALRHLDGVHLVVVCVPRSGTRPALRLAEQARRDGVADRVHFLDPVEPGQVVAYLSSADVGLVPMQGGWLNHELTLPNKLFEYVAAGVPVVASDLRSLGAVVRENGLGETFPPGDAAALAVAVRRVLDDREGYRRSVTAPDVRRRFSWSAQEEVLRRVYSDLIGPGSPRPGADHTQLSLAERPVRRAVPTDGDPRSVALGPLNTAGQATALAAAVRCHLPAVTVDATMLGRRRSDPPVDVAVSRDVYRRDLVWQGTRLRTLLQHVTHALLEDGLPLAGTAHGEDGYEQAAMLADAGVRLGYWIPRQGDEASIERAEGWRQALDCTVLVADETQADLLPHAVWLPAVVDVPDGVGLSWDGERRPLVATTRRLPQLEGVLTSWQASGRLTFDPEALPAADIVLDDGSGSTPGVVALQATARGSLVLRPRPDVPRRPAGEDLVEALDELLRDPGPGLDDARRDIERVRQVHDGRRSAAVLAAFLGLGEPQSGS